MQDIVLYCDEHNFPEGYCLSGIFLHLSAARKKFPGAAVFVL